MMIKNTPSVGGVDPATSKPQTSAPVPQRSPDRVTTADFQQAAALARALQSKAGLTRTARVAQVEAAVNSGNYEPSASELARQMVNAAEIDARLQAMLRG